MPYILRTHLVSEILEQEILLEEETLTYEQARHYIDELGMQETGNGWETPLSRNERITITIQPNPETVRKHAAHGTSKTHYINTRWWMGDFGTDGG